VSISKVPAPQTVRAADQQPSCFAGFLTSAEMVDRVRLRRLMKCECGGAEGTLKATAGWQDFPWADPLSFTCGACAVSRQFFNSHRDGYDNVMENGATSSQGVEPVIVACPECKTERLIVTSELLYNIDPDEIDEELDGRSATPSDCFDAFNAFARCSDCQHEFYVGGWELA
jgi:hypothetical protein